MKKYILLILIILNIYAISSYAQIIITVDSTLTMSRSEVLSLRNAVVQNQSDSNPYYYYYKKHLDGDSIQVPQPFSGGNRMLKAKWDVHSDIIFSLS